MPRTQEESSTTAIIADQADAERYATMVKAARQLELPDVKFPVVLEALAEAHGCTEHFEVLETKKALYTSSLHFTLADLVNAGSRLMQMDMTEPEIVKRLQHYLAPWSVERTGVFVGNCEKEVVEDSRQNQPILPPLARTPCRASLGLQVP